MPDADDPLGSGLRFFQAKGEKIEMLSRRCLWIHQVTLVESLFIQDSQVGLQD
jgi:uncharacterized membrane protein